MVWNQVKELPLFWKPFYSFSFAVTAALLLPTLFAAVIGFLAFRSRIRGVYFAIITQALALSVWLVFNRNETNLGGTNGLTDFKKVIGFRLNDPGTQRALYMLTVVCLIAAYLLCRWIIRSRTGKVLVAIRDSEQRVLFSGYSPANYKLFVFTLSAVLAGLAGALYVPQVGIINPSAFSPANSIEVAIWVAVGGRGTLIGAALGAVLVNYAKTTFTTGLLAPYWLFVLGALFVLVTIFLPKGIFGLLSNRVPRLEDNGAPAPRGAAQPAE